MRSVSEGHLNRPAGLSTEQEHLAVREPISCNERWTMNRWQALVEIVKSFNERGATNLAFATVCVLVIMPLLLAMVVALQLGVSSHLPWFGSG